MGGGRRLSTGSDDGNDGIARFSINSLESSGSALQRSLSALSQGSCGRRSMPGSMAAALMEMKDTEQSSMIAECGDESDVPHSGNNACQNAAEHDVAHTNYDSGPSAKHEGDDKSVALDRAGGELSSAAESSHRLHTDRSMHRCVL